MKLLKWLNIHTHEWTPWVTVQKADIMLGSPPLVQMFTGSPNWYVGGEATKQKRQCKTCGLMQTKMEKIYY